MKCCVPPRIAAPGWAERHGEACSRELADGDPDLPQMFEEAGGGFGQEGRTSLFRALRDDAGIGKGRKAAAGLIEVGCLKICPKHAVMVVDTTRPGDWLVVKAGTPVAEVVEMLGLSEAR